MKRGKNMIVLRAAWLPALLLLGAVSPAGAHPSGAHETATVEKIDASLQAPAAVVDAFHAALARGDTASASALLADDALIFESGGAERSKAEYAAHHLGADAKFAQAVPRSITSRSGVAVGDMAWIATEGRTTGTYGDRAIDSVSTETMVLRKGGDGWKIAHIHWSSAKAK
jgi:ketosteroid isomerase-like protein